MPTVTFDITPDSNDGNGVRQAATWAGIGSGTYTDAPGDLIIIDKDVAAGPLYSAAVGYLRFDTSSIPDAAAISSATLKMFLSSRDISFGAYNCEADYYDFGGEPSVAADWIETVAASVITPVLGSSMTVGAVNNMTVSDLSGINKSGFTGIRLAVSAGTPVNNTLELELLFSSAESTNQGPQLEVTYGTPALMPRHSLGAGAGRW